MKTGVMSVNFKLTCAWNVLVSNDTFKSFCNILAVASDLILSIFGEILSLVDDLLGSMSLTYFTTSLKATGSNENLFWLSTFLLIRMMLGWYLCISMALSTGSSTFWKFWFMILEFSSISNVETAFSNKCLILQQFFYHLAVLHLFSRGFCYFQSFLNLRKVVWPFSKTTYYHWQKRDLVSYRISSNKHRASNKSRTFGYSHWNKRLLLISAFPLISVAPTNVALIRTLTIFYQ